MINHLLWTEKYRPKNISECVLPDRIKNIFQKYVDDKNVPNLLLSGKSGVGKTTVAIAMCEEIGLDYILINSSDDRGIETLRTTVKNYASGVSFSGTRKVVIFDEADYLTPVAQAGLRGIIEEFASNCSFIFTCNFKLKLIEAIHSRCSVIDFALNSAEVTKMQALFFKKIQSILDAERVKYDDTVLVKIIKFYFPDYRRTINELQRYSKIGNIDVAVLSILNNIQNVDDLISHLRNNDFSAMRLWVAENKDVDPSMIYRKIYDSLYQFLTPESIAQAILIIAKYQYQSAFVVDQEINIVACLTEIMIDCQCK